MNRWVVTSLVLALCGILTVGGAGSARADWFSLDGGEISEPALIVDQLAANLTRVEVIPTGFSHDPVVINGQEYLSLRMPGHWFSLKEGQPELPFLAIRLEIPGLGSPKVRIVESSWREVVISPPVPSKGNIPRDVDPDLVPWTFGDSYSGGVYPREVAELGSPFILRDLRGVGLRVHPLRWDSDRQILLTLERLVLEVETTGTGGVNEKTETSQPMMDAQFEQMYSLGFDNYRNLEKYNRVEANGPLLIVCPEEFLPAIDSFRQWKLQRGLPVEMITTESLGAGAADIRAGIQAAINDRYYSSAGLTFVILVGDLEQVPTNLGAYEEAHDDTRYGCVEGDDPYPDLFVSRISAATVTDVQTQVNKFIHYERDPDPAGSWFSRASGLASSQGVPTDAVRAGWLRDDLLSYTFDEVDEIYAPMGLTSLVNAALNEGRSLINYLGHGTGVSWSNPYFGIEEVHALQNGWKMPWILDVSCNNGDFQRPECFAEAWLRAGTPEQPQGAVAMYSASTTTPWVPPCVMQAEAVELLVNGKANVIGSLYYHGIMEVLDTYPGDEGLQLVEQYNIFGDCSLVVRTDRPLALDVRHPSSIPLGAVEFPVETDLAGATVALFSQGVLYGAGVAGPTGRVVLDLNLPVVEVSSVTLTVTGYNRIPFIVELPAVPAQGFNIEPGEIPVGETTRVTVTLWDPVKAVADVQVRIDGLGVDGLEALTGPDGVAAFDVTPRYGETLRVSGRETGALFDLFAGDLPVSGGIPLTGAAITAEAPAIGLQDTLAINLEGHVTGSALESGLTLGLEFFDTLALYTSMGESVTGSLTPQWPGLLKASLMKEGYQVFTVDVVVVQGMGTLNGTVVDGDADSATIYKARVFGFLAGEEITGVPAFDVVSDFYGNWAMPAEVPLGNYEIHVQKLGYLDHAEPFFLNFGSNVLTLSLTQAPRGLITGSVVSAEDGADLFTLVQAFRTDTGEEVGDTWSSGAGGTFTLPPLAYFEYDILVSPDKFTPRKQRITVGQPLQELHFSLEPTNGSVLILDDSLARDGSTEVPIEHPARLDKLGGELAPAYTAPASRSALDILGDLVILGYDIEYSPSVGYDPGAWTDHDLVLVSSADQTGTLNPQLKEDLAAYTAAGGKLLIEGGDVAFEHITDGDFARQVLHISEWVTDNPGDVGVYQALHPVMSYPNPLTASIEFNGSGSASGDAVCSLDDAVTVASWTNSWSDASIVCYGPESLLGAGQIVFLAFDYGSLDTGGRVDLLHNAVHWLIAPEAGLASVSGRVDVVHAPDGGGVTLNLSPGNRTVVTGPDGAFSFGSLYAGNYTLTVSKPGWTSHIFSFGLTQEQILTGVDFELSDVAVAEYWDSPGLVIPDNDPAGVTCSITNSLNERATRVEVFLDITHPYLADLVIDLVCPSGESVRLHQNNGGDGDDIHAWYPTEMPSYGVLDRFIGEGIYGTWHLHAEDCGPYDQGVINRWGLRITYAAGLTGVDDDQLPAVLTLEGNHPNPFNPSTAILFALPQSGPVELSVFDLAGRRIAVLVNEVRRAGRHEAVWDGRDVTGRAVATGTYFYQLKTESGTKTGKMLLVK